MKERLEAIKKAALEKIEQADAMDSLNDIRVSVLGKKGELTQVLKGMKDVAKEERPIVGQMVNDTRAVIEEALEKEMTLLKKKVREEKMKREVIDVTLPGKTHEKGHRHPNQIALEDLERVFIGMGYEVVEGPEVEYDKYNFEMLNIPANHPAKEGYILYQQRYRVKNTDISCTGTYHGNRKNANPYDRTWTSIPF